MIMGGRVDVSNLLFLGIFQVDQPLVFRGFWPKKTEEVLPARELDLPWFFRDFPLLVVLIRLVLWRFRPRYPTQGIQESKAGCG